MSDITTAKPVICDRCGEAIDFRVFPAAIHVIGEKNYHIGCVATAPDPRDAENARLTARIEELTALLREAQIHCQHDPVSNALGNRIEAILRDGPNA